MVQIFNQIHFLILSIQKTLKHSLNKKVAFILFQFNIVVFI